MMQELTIIKIGGKVVDDEALLISVLKDFAAIPGHKILVHGGGKIASRTSEQLGITPHMVEGRRVTDAETLKVVTMVYGGLVNKNIVAQLQAIRCNAIGLTGADANIITAEKRAVAKVDYGLVGDVLADQLNGEIIQSFLEQGLIPVFAPITHDGKGQLLNTNADTIASSLAVSLAAFFKVQLVYCFEKKGVLADPENEDAVIPVINSEKYTTLVEDGTVSAGMLPKLENAFAALKNGVESVIICSSENLNLQDNYGGTKICLN